MEIDIHGQTILLKNGSRDTLMILVYANAFTEWTTTTIITLGSEILGSP